MVTIAARPFTTGNRCFFAGAGWLALWLLACLTGPLLQASFGLNVPADGHGHLHSHGHPFIDARVWWGVPNALDVVSNLPLLMAGLLGLCLLSRADVDTATRAALRIFFAGLAFAGVGSAFYHWAPDPVGLSLDRLGMAVAFSGALALAVSERSGPRPARAALCVVLPMALISAILPLWHGHVLPWAVVQFGGMALLVAAALQPLRPGALGVRLGVLIALYALAKLFEMGDEAVFLATDETVSGHSLKHVVAALAAWPVLHALRQNPRARNGAPVSAHQ